VSHMSNSYLKAAYVTKMSLRKLPKLLDKGMLQNVAKCYNAFAENFRYQGSAILENASTHIEMRGAKKRAKSRGYDPLSCPFSAYSYISM